MSSREAINQTAIFIENKFKNEGTGHDWWHIYRVWQLSKHIAEHEKNVDMLVVELAALLHDIADWKFHDGDSEAGPKAARSWLERIKVDEEVTKQVEYVVRHISFKGGVNIHKMQTIEGKIVQDADRLDAMGAIGVARTFAFGGSANRPIYDPAIKPKKYKTVEEFKGSIKTNTTINHFYEKLLLLKDMMNTKTGTDLAKNRHRYMESYLKEFYAEWEGGK